MVLGRSARVIARGLFAALPSFRLAGRPSFLNAVKVLLRETRTGLYYVGPNQWASRSEFSTDFETIERAEQKAASEKMRGMEMVLIYGTAPHEITRPLSGG